jgi:hypothetical protein
MLNILFGELTFSYFTAEIMTTFSARFDAKAAKDAKGKGKVNPPASPSQGGPAAVAGSNPGIGATAVSTARDSPQGGKNPVAPGAQVGGEVRPSKKARFFQGKICFYSSYLFICFPMFVFSCF